MEAETTSKKGNSSIKPGRSSSVTLVSGKLYPSSVRARGREWGTGWGVEVRLYVRAGERDGMGAETDARWEGACVCPLLMAGSPG